MTQNADFLAVHPEAGGRSALDRQGAVEGRPRTFIAETGGQNIPALFAGTRDELLALTRRLAERDGPIVPVHVAPYPLEFLVDEVSLSVNTAAAGGNASLMSIG